MELSPPPRNDPGATMRWVRRVQLLTAIPGLLVSVLLLAMGEDLWWLPAAGAGLVLFGAATMGPAIGRAEARGPFPESEVPERQRRAIRVTGVMVLVATAIAAVVFYLLLGLGGAIFVTVLFLASGALGLYLTRRWIV